MQHRRLIALLLSILLVALPASAAPASPTAAVGNDTTYGGTTAWANPTNIFSSNDTYTTATAKGSNCGGLVDNQTLRASGFGFALPAGVTVVGIVVALEGKASWSDCGFQSGFAEWVVALGKAGVLNSTFTRGGSSEGGFCFSGSVDTTCTVGTTSDTWGQTWTPAEINAADFSVGVHLNGNNTSISLDHLTATITFVSVSKGLVVETRRPSRWEPLNSWEWWAGTGVTMAAAWGDSYSTNVSRRRCPYPYCEETNPLLGPNPSSRKVYAVTLSLAAARRVAVALIWRRRPREGRVLSWLEAGGSAAGHGWAIRQNLQLRKTP